MELADCRWVLTSELAAPESALRRALAERGSTGKLDVPVRTDDPLLIYRLVSSTDSVSLMRSELMESGLMLGDVRKIELDDFTIEDEIVLYTKRASRGHKSAELFREALLTHAAELRRKAGS
jgi:DNA-binding transcriptional LysR family regulator